MHSNGRCLEVQKVGSSKVLTAGQEIGEHTMNNRTLFSLSNFAGYASILASIAIWAARGGQSSTPEQKAHGERFGIFVGLWAPTFFILANRMERAAKEEESKNQN
jgi:hypothetical protein